MKVVYADDHDARLAAVAIYRLGSIAASQRIQSPSSSEMQLDVDHRYDQLIECIELRIRSIKVADLSRYLWAAITLRVVDEDQANFALNEYIRRLSSDDESCAITTEEGAAILWAVGCLKDTFGWTSAKLITLLCEHLSEGVLSELSSKLIVRALWSLAVHNCYDADLSKELFAIIDKREFVNLPGTNAISLLWSIAQFKDSIDNDILMRLLDRIIDVIGDIESYLRVTEIGLAADALVILDETIRKIEIIAKGRCNSGLQNEKFSMEHQNLEDLKTLSTSIEKTINVLLGRFMITYGSSSSSSLLSISFIISLLRVAIRSTSTHQSLWDFALIQLQNIIQNNNPISVLEAANILEMIAHVPRVLLLASSDIDSKDENSFNNSMIDDSNITITSPSIPLSPLSPTNISTNSSFSQDSTKSSSNTSSSLPTFSRTINITHPLSSTSSPATSTSLSSSEIPRFCNSKSIQNGITRQPEWHGIAGKLAAITASNSGQIKNKTCLINACWAIALLGYPYRKLLTIVRKRIQFALHELSPNLLSRLVVAVAAEECIVGNIVPTSTSGLSASPKLDREFVDQVALSVYYNLVDITPISDQISAMFAVACLGRLTSFEMRPSSINAQLPPNKGDDKNKDNRRQVIFTNTQLESLSTSVLIKLLWAMHRLPVGVVEYATMEAVRIQIGSRNLDLRQESSTSLHDDITKEDLKLYVRVLSEIMVDLKKPDGSVAYACNSLLLQLQLRQFQSINEKDTASLKETSALSQIVVDAVSLTDALQSFIDLKWYQPEAIKYFEVQCSLLSEKYATFPRSEKLCASSYHISRLEQLIKIFKESSAATKSDDFGYDIGKRLSRWLGIQ